MAVSVNGRPFYTLPGTLPEKQIKAAERELSKAGAPGQIEEFNGQIDELTKALSTLDETWAELRSQRSVNR
jgi:hypothetical protein